MASHYNAAQSGWRQNRLCNRLKFQFSLLEERVIGSMWKSRSVMLLTPPRSSYSICRVSEHYHYTINIPINSTVRTTDIARQCIYFLNFYRFHGTINLANLIVKCLQERTKYFWEFNFAIVTWGEDTTRPRDVKRNLPSGVEAGRQRRQYLPTARSPTINRTTIGRDPWREMELSWR